MKRIYLSIISLCSFSIMALSCFASSNDFPYPIQEVTTGIFYHQGVHEDASEQNIGAIANVGFIIGERCVAVIDSGGSYREGVLLRQAIKQKTDLPVCYVINTHVHPDHTFGNAAFKHDQPEYVGHVKLGPALEARQPFFARVFEEMLGRAYEGTEFIGPTLTVNEGEPLNLDLGNRTITISAYPTSHTDHDITVLDNNTKTLWTGDLLFVDRIPVMDGSINGWLPIMQRLSEMDLNYVIPGHGAASQVEWQQGFVDQIRYFSSIREGIREIIADFGTIDDATQQVGLEEKKNWELFDEYHRRNITASFVELEWE